MTLYHFKESFKRGLGSALLELKNSDNKDKYKETVLWCCLHNTCYDMQCEGDRGEYLYTAIECFNDRIYFEQEIINKYRQRSIDSWLFDQLSSLLYEFAVDGSQHARKALYQKYDYLFNELFKKRKQEGQWKERDLFEWLCIWLTSLDGFKAFRQILIGIGTYYERKKVPRELALDWFYNNSKSKFGKKRVRDYIQKQAEKSRGIAIFLNEVQDFETEYQHESKPAFTSPELKDYLLYCKSEKRLGYGIERRFARFASKEDLKALADAALEESNKELKSALLRPFRFTAFPLDIKHIFDLTESEDINIRENALTILELLPGPDVHDYTIKLLRKGDDISGAISLLSKNYHNEDEEILFKSLKKLKPRYNDGSWHGAYMSVEDIYFSKRFKPNINILLYMYRNTLCSYCRNSVVEIMHKRNVLPKDILEECMYDSYDETRELVKRIILKQSDKS